MRKGSLLVSIVLAVQPLAATEPPAATGPFAVSGPLAGVRLVTVATGLGPVTSITQAGDGRLFLTEKSGAVRIVAGGAVHAAPFLDLSALVSTESERGLLGLAFHPRHGENGWFFVDYTDPAGAVVVARYQVSAADPDRADPERPSDEIVEPDPPRRQIAPGRAGVEPDPGLGGEPLDLLGLDEGDVPDLVVARRTLRGLHDVAIAGQADAGDGLGGLHGAHRPTLAVREVDPFERALVSRRHASPTVSRIGRSRRGPRTRRR
jgi:hypothetical protein